MNDLSWPNYMYNNNIITSSFGLLAGNPNNFSLGVVLAGQGVVGSHSCPEASYIASYGCNRCVARLWG